MKWSLSAHRAEFGVVLLLAAFAAAGADAQPATAASRALARELAMIAAEETAWSARGYRARTVAVRGPRGGMAVGPRGAMARQAGRKPGFAAGHRPGINRLGRPPGVGHAHRPIRPGSRPGYRPIVVAPGWRRPASYWWRPGGAIAAGAAIGFIGAAAAASYSYAGPPPGTGYCWYYTNPERTQGFWDLCP